MTMRLLIVAVLTLLDAGCAHERPRISYFCEATLTNENGEFRANANEVQWRYDIGDGMQASLSLPHSWQAADDFRTHGFGRVLDSPGLVITFDRRFSRNDWMQRPPRLSAAGEIRIGDQSHVKWVSNSDMVVFMYSEWRALLTQEGDMEVVLFETPERAVVQRGVIPRRVLESLQPTLQRLSARTVEMERDPPTRCTPFEEEEIVVT